jgi:predicted lipoprotein
MIMSYFTKRAPVKVLTPVLLSIVLTACGGGGSDSPTPATGGGGSESPAPATSTDDEQFGLWLTDLSNNFILPSYQDLQTKAQALSAQSTTFCALSNAANNDLEPLRQSWADFNASWQDIQWLKVGPVLESSRNFRIEFWPDSNNAVESGLNSLLNTVEPLTAEYVSGKNVGGQGISALEILLFTDTVQDSLLTASNKEKRCEAVQAISENLAIITDQINTEWQSSGGNYVASFTTGTGEFTGKKDAVEELITNWLEQVERVKDEKLLQPLAINAPGIPTIAELVLSDSSIASVRINAKTFSKLFTANDGHGFDDILTDHFEQQAISTEITTKIVAISTALNTLDTNMSYAELLNDETSRIQLAETIQKIRELRDVITADFIQATDINIGFNSNDGD